MYAPVQQISDVDQAVTASAGSSPSAGMCRLSTMCRDRLPELQRNMIEPCFLTCFVYVICLLC